MKTVGEVVEGHIHGGDWANAVIILTTGADEPVKHEELDGTHFFVFDAVRLQERRYTATTAFLGQTASSRPQMLDAYLLLKQSPETLRKAMLASNAHALLSGLSAAEANHLLPLAFGVVARAFEGAQGGAVSLHTGALTGEDFEVLIRALRRLLDIARSRGDVTAIHSILDGFTEEQRMYFRSNPDIVKAVAEEDIAAFEVTSWAYRKRQVDIYSRLLSAPEAVQAYKAEHGITRAGEESAWQYFFEHNQWIFGFALNFHFNEAVSGDRLEVYSKGGTFLEDGKRPDAVMGTVALIRSLCFVEIKTPRKQLMGAKYRDDVWAASDELVGAIAQSQKAVYRSIRELSERFRLVDSEGTEHGHLSIPYIRVRS